MTSCKVCSSLFVGRSKTPLVHSLLKFTQMDTFWARVKILSGSPLSFLRTSQIKDFSIKALLLVGGHEFEKNCFGSNVSYLLEPRQR